LVREVEPDHHPPHAPIAKRTFLRS
jgi:hypothetical protein